MSYGFTPITPGTGANVAQDTIAGLIFQRLKMAFGAEGSASEVTKDTPLPVEDQPYRGAVAIVVGTDQTPQRAILINCTVAGNVVLKLSDNSLLTLPIDVGLSRLGFAVKTVVAANTTATATYTNLK